MDDSEIMFNALMLLIDSLGMGMLESMRVHIDSVLEVRYREERARAIAEVLERLEEANLTVDDLMRAKECAARVSGRH